MKEFFRNGGVGEVLKIALPLVVATSCHAVNNLVDRIMLSHYSQDAMAAAMPAGVTNFSCACLFFGIATYSGAFVAQYTGAGMKHRVGPAVWQGLWIALVGGAFMACCCLFSPQLFRIFGHSPAIRELEVQYFNILAAGAVVMLGSVALSTFWSGRGLTGMVMTNGLVSTLCNIPFNYLLIFGATWRIGTWEFVIPELGVAGAAYGTVAATLVSFVIYAAGFLLPFGARRTYHTLSFTPEADLLKRLIRFGTPNGVQILLDVAAFNIFVVVLGKINDTVLAASGIALSLHFLVFQPTNGVGQTASILVGQSIGAADIPRAKRTVRSAAVIIFAYLSLMALLFVLWPDPALRLFNLQSAEVDALTRFMLRFCAVYIFFDGMNILFGCTIKGAGDTKAAMWIGISSAWIFYALPSVLAFNYFTSGEVVARIGAAAAADRCLWAMWIVNDFYIFCCGVLMLWRYLTGKWTKMRVIERGTPSPATE
ncbi:MAG: MATE family efflux transporter [Lentisphaeria bacterium]|nr:MATE family efflux transporter [Lentisphaeria bacterium]